jgi:hypothetical protein
MPRLVMKSCHFWTGLAILCTPATALEPVPHTVAVSATPAPSATSSYSSLDEIPPPPLAPVPDSPSLPPGSPPQISTVSPNVSSYYGYQGGSALDGAAYGTGAIYGTPGGYEGRIGSPFHYFDPNGGHYMVTGDPYYDHFGPGFHWHSLYGHYRFPYYNYRAPWYYPGRAVYQRDTNFAW